MYVEISLLLDLIKNDFNLNQISSESLLADFFSNG